MKVPLWERSVILYSLAIALVLGLVNVEIAQQQRAISLLRMHAKSAEGPERARIGVLYYDTWTQLAPQDADAFVKLAICYYRLGQERQAVAAYNKALKLLLDPKKVIIK